MSSLGQTVNAGQVKLRKSYWESVGYCCKRDELVIPLFVHARVMFTIFSRKLTPLSVSYVWVSSTQQITVVATKF